MGFLDILVDNLNHSIHRYEFPKKYLASRGIGEVEIEKYKIGYNNYINLKNDGSEDFKRFLYEMHEGKDLKSFLIFPIRDHIGKVVGIVCRKIKQKVYLKFFLEEAKFSGCFFGFFEALPHIYETGKAYVSEGAFDSMVVAKVFPNTIGALTAGIDDGQYDLLNFYCDHIITVFDNDKEGIRESKKAEKKWNNVRPITLGKYKDPSRCFNMLKEDKFKKLLKNTIVL